MKVSAKVGDLVRIKSRFRNAPIGLIVSIERRDGSYAGGRVKVQWFDGRDDSYYPRSMSNLEVVSD